MQTTQRAETAQLKTVTASVTATSEAVPAVLPYIIACKTKLVSDMRLAMSWNPEPSHK